MADDSGKTQTLSEQYLLKDKGEENAQTVTKLAVEETEVEAPTNEPSFEEVVTPETEETLAAVESEELAADTVGETKEDAPNVVESAEEAVPAEETIEDMFSHVTST